MVKVSAIVPVYNGEEFIESCIKDILNQTLKNIELILINDGSKDNTLEICQKYVEYDSRITLINQENKGVSRARNNGINKAKGKYICFIDSDDRIKEDYLENLYNIAETKDVKIVCCDIECVDKNYKFKFIRTMGEGYYRYFEALEELFKFKNLNWGPCGKLLKLEIIKDKIEFPNVDVYEDLVFVYKSIYNTDKIYYTNATKYYYVDRENNSAMRKFIKNPTIDIIKVTDEAISFLRDEIPYILDSSFYGLISGVIMYFYNIKQSDKKLKNPNSKLYIKEMRRLILKYKNEFILNKNMHYKEKIKILLLLIFK